MPSDEALREWREEVRKEYKDERRDANDKYFQHASQLSKLILTISAGALTLSFGFLGKIDNEENISILRCLWLFLGATVIFGFTSASFSLMALKRGRDIVEEYYDKLMKSDPYKNEQIKYSLNIWNYLLAVSNVIVFISFIGAFVFAVRRCQIICV